MPRKLTEADLKVGTKFVFDEDKYHVREIVHIIKQNVIEKYVVIVTLKGDRITGYSNTYGETSLLDRGYLYEEPIKKEVEFYCGVYEKGEINRHDAMAKTFNVNTCLLRFENLDDIKSESYKRVIKITGTAELINIGEDNE
jgi:hypothetical protein